MYLFRINSQTSKTFAIRNIIFPPLPPNSSSKFVPLLSSSEIQRKNRSDRYASIFFPLVANVSRNSLRSIEQTFTVIRDRSANRLTGRKNLGASEKTIKGSQAATSAAAIWALTTWKKKKSKLLRQYARTRAQRETERGRGERKREREINRKRQSQVILRGLNSCRSEVLNRDGINYGDRSVVAEDRVILADPRRRQGLIRLIIRKRFIALLKNEPATDGNRGSIEAMRLGTDSLKIILLRVNDLAAQFDCNVIIRQQDSRKFPRVFVHESTNDVTHTTGSIHLEDSRNFVAQF